ncbi:DeoR/GlpR family DNA-binding transcription regulator [Cytobacillus firmus]|uniref:DeoR family transcriptional regulator n=1 Tax=Cytobacillus firmus DS1 TaxID=1307436 RepID=W7L4C0_CYTFI|nr:DeoR/GlpR family DNA-binding transcription regulator [Cytobacillus firmus]EWG10007.1 DeoR family transcriptional regulator [Cytobacillus firmus DS1]
MLIGRHKTILNLLEDVSTLNVEDLALKLKVSEVTIRRDLSFLEKQGLIVRERGKATLQVPGFEPLYNQRQRKHIEEKRKIAKYVVEQIKEGEVIALDVGTTTAEIAKELLKRSNITIFTSSLQVANILSRSSSLEVYMIGGLIRKNEMSLIGSMALETVKKFNFDKYYFGAAGMEFESGPTDYSIEEAEVKRAFISRSRKVIAVVDHSKFMEKALVRLCDFNQIDEIVTNARESHPLHPGLKNITNVTFV